MPRKYVLGATALALLAGGLVSCAKHAARTEPGVFVLGIDGMDPVILQRMIDEGKMPNFAHLAEEGGFQSLGTSTPPQSPVAWSTFITGLDPGGHGIFDFVHRDPKTYMPISSALPPPSDPGTAIDFFGWYLPIGGDDPVNNRTGTAFWDTLQKAGVDVEVYRIPGDYPVTESDAKVLSGMGTVDMRGGYGVYTWFTDQPMTDRGELKGDIQLVNVADYDLDGKPDTVNASLKGPPDLFHLPPGKNPGANDYLTAPVSFFVDPDQDVVLIRAGDSEAVAKVGEWTDWMPVSYDALPYGAMSLEGQVRFYVKSLRAGPSGGGFAIYASPVNISSADPPQDISTPSDFATDVYDLVGRFYTQGMPEETNALKDGTFSDDDYIKQVGLVQDDAREMLDLALSRFKPGDTSFFYLSDIDLQCHMLWRHGDPKYADAPPHPAYDAASGPAHAHDIEHFYEHVDLLLGRVRQRLPADATLIVMSDHGFQPYTREFNLNSWLRDQGLLVLKDKPAGASAAPATGDTTAQLETLGYTDKANDAKAVGHIAQGDVDWSKTKAYGIGFNGLYVNLKGREGEGIVDPADEPALLAEISQKLTDLVDEKNGKHPVLEVDRSADVYSGARMAEAPDLIVGYDVGYGCSDQSTLGEITSQILTDNTSRWSGNHLMAAKVVPGVLLSNHKIPAAGHTLTDVTATLLGQYGIAPTAGMKGHDIFK
jgi:predicted AlkP superfamily phosphohydrolase/phosphomutase